MKVFLLKNSASECLFSEINRLDIFVFSCKIYMYLDNVITP